MTKKAETKAMWGEKKETPRVGPVQDQVRTGTAPTGGEKKTEGKIRPDQEARRVLPLSEGPKKSPQKKKTSAGAPEVPRPSEKHWGGETWSRKKKPKGVGGTRGVVRGENQPPSTGGKGGRGKRAKNGNWQDREQGKKTKKAKLKCWGKKQKVPRHQGCPPGEWKKKSKQNETVRKKKKEM